MSKDQTGCYYCLVIVVETHFIYAHLYLSSLAHTNKTFFYQVLYHYFSSKRDIVLYITLFKSAILLLSHWRTFYFQFKILFEYVPNGICNITGQSQLASLLTCIISIIWDEVFMQNKKNFVIVNIRL